MLNNFSNAVFNDNKKNRQDFFVQTSCQPKLLEKGNWKFEAELNLFPNKNVNR